MNRNVNKSSRYTPRTRWVDPEVAYLNKQDPPADDEETVTEGDEEVIETVYEYDIPEDLTAEDFDVAETLKTAEAAFLAEAGRDNPDRKTIDQLADDIEALRAENDRRDAAVEEERAAIAERAAKLNLVVDKSDSEVEEEEEEEAPVEEAGDDVDLETSEEVSEEVEEESASAIAAGGRRVTTTKTRPRSKRPPATEEIPSDNADLSANPYGWELVAAKSGQDLSEGRLATGSVITMEQLGERAKAMNSGTSKREAGTNAYIAQFQLSVPEEHKLSSVSEDEARRFAAANDPSLDQGYPIAPTEYDFDEGGALVAGAACGMVEHDYTLYNDSRVGKLLTLPSRVMPRGALELWEPGSSLCDIIDQLADNTVCLPGETKTEVELACPTPMPVCETCARYLIIKYDNFRARSDAGEYAVELRKHLDAHMINKHLDNLHSILTDPTTDLRDLSGSAAYPGSIEKDFWVQLSVQAQGIRNEYCLPDDYALTAVVPCWIPNAIRDAVAREMGCGADDVNEAMVRRCFARHAGATVQFVDWWQRLDPANDEYPNWVDVLLMPSDSWFEGTQGTLNLGSEIRDSTNNSVNCYTSFTEDFYTTCRRKYGARLVRSNICVTGASPERVVIPCSAVPGVDSTVRPSFATSK